MTWLDIALIMFAAYFFYSWDKSPDRRSHMAITELVLGIVCVLAVALPRLIK